MEKNNIVFDETINGFRYIIRKYNLGNTQQYMKLESAIPNDTPLVYLIEYSEETNTFQMTDYIEIQGRRIKVMFNLDLDLRIVGFVYNDLDGAYDMVNPTEYFREDVVFDTEEVYEEYKKRLIARLTELLTKQEIKYHEDNNKMLSLKTKNND